MEEKKGINILNKIIIFLQMIKIEHSIFALPFAYLGILLSLGKISFDRNFLWITVAMVGARSFAMAFNRYVDKEIDIRNPRTQDRALPKKLLTENEVIVFSFLTLVIYISAAFELSPLCRYLWPFLVLPMIIYPYTKRFTYLSHFVLGISLGLSPIGAWIGITNTLPSMKVLLLGLAICFWTAGFDIIYACQDINFDCKEGLYSIPAYFGLEKALKTTAFLHFLTVILLFATGFLFRLKLFYFFGVLTVASVLWYENHIVSPKDLSRVNVAFFTANGFISILIFIFTWIDFYFKN
ncbi:MAG: UbiA family prenyltransferase [Candidatus Firestonebacteria bacterium]|nr:UbiA family prenyltransferase [Candidatus Firestonebacteria bacterium]